MTYCFGKASLWYKYWSMTRDCVEEQHLNISLLFFYVIGNYSVPWLGLNWSPSQCSVFILKYYWFLWTMPGNRSWFLVTLKFFVSWYSLEKSVALQYTNNTMSPLIIVLREHGFWSLHTLVGDCGIWLFLSLVLWKCLHSDYTKQQAVISKEYPSST